MQRFILPTGDRTYTLPRLFAFLTALSPDMPWEIVVKRFKAIRSNEQNRYLWSIYEHILRTCGEDLRGYTKEELHEFFLGSHFGWESMEIFGRKDERPLRRSSKLSKGEFAEFVAFIQRFMAERGVLIADPNEEVA